MGENVWDYPSILRGKWDGKNRRMGRSKKRAVACKFYEERHRRGVVINNAAGPLPFPSTLFMAENL